MVIFQNTKEGSLFALVTKDGLNTKALVAVLISAIISGLTEFFSGHAWNGFLDDNLTIPLAAAFTLASSVMCLPASAATFNSSEPEPQVGS